jgi:hypothetical protein
MEGDSEEGALSEGRPVAEAAAQYHFQQDPGQRKMTMIPNLLRNSADDDL